MEHILPANSDVLADAVSVRCMCKCNDFRLHVWKRKLMKHIRSPHDQSPSCCQLLTAERRSLWKHCKQSSLVCWDGCAFCRWSVAWSALLHQTCCPQQREAKQMPGLGRKTQAFTCGHDYSLPTWRRQRWVCFLPYFSHFTPYWNHDYFQLFQLMKQFENKTCLLYFNVSWKWNNNNNNNNWIFFYSNCTY